MMRAKNPRRTTSILFPLAVGGALAYGCADPHGDLDDFKSRSTDAQNQGGSGGSGGEGGSGGVGGEGGATKLADIKGTFVFACANAIFEDISTAIRFRSNNQMTLNGEGGSAPTGGKVSIEVQPIKLGAATVDEVLGDPTNIDMPAEVDSKGVFGFTVASVKVDGKANPSGNNISLSNVVYRAAIVSEDLYCARFGANIDDPPLSPLDINDPKNTCVGVRVEPGGAPPNITPGELTNCKTIMAGVLAP